MNKTKLTADVIAKFVAQVAVWFLSAGFIMWGWNTIAPHINCPIFTYWEIFAMRAGLSWVMRILWQKND